MLNLNYFTKKTFSPAKRFSTEIDTENLDFVMKTLNYKMSPLLIIICDKGKRLVEQMIETIKPLTVDNNCKVIFIKEENKLQTKHKTEEILPEQ